MAEYFEKLETGNVCHIFNKSIGNELLFKMDKDYYYFREKLSRFILPFCDLFAYCLIPKHFHLLLKIKDVIDDTSINGEIIKKAFSDFFNSYAKSFNQAHDRIGKLFNLPFRRIQVSGEDYFSWLVCYIHRNTVHHNITSDYVNYKYSSYHEILHQNGIVESEFVIQWFGGHDEFISYHEINIKLNDSDVFSLE